MRVKTPTTNRRKLLWWIWVHWSCPLLRYSTYMGHTYKCLGAVYSLDFILRGQKSFNCLLDLKIQNSWILLSSNDWFSHWCNWHLIVRVAILTTGHIHRMKGRPDLANTDKSKCCAAMCEWLQSICKHTRILTC